MLEYDVKDSKLDQRNERARTQGWRGEGGGGGGGGGSLDKNFTYHMHLHESCPAI